MPTPGPKVRRALIAAAAVAVVLVAVVLFVLLHGPGNVSHPNLSFTQPTSTAARPTPKGTRAAAAPFLWPRYGYDAARTRDFAAPASLAPPFRVGWRFADGALVEFPPVVDGHTLYLLDDDGAARAIDAVTGHVDWLRKIGDLAAASPAIDAADGLVMLVVLSANGHAPGGGHVDALSMRTGRIAWTRAVPAGSESSPIVYGDTVYFGDQSGTVYSLAARTGRVNWTYRASAAVKGGPALSNGILYFGDYAGRAYALHATTGRVLWAVSTAGAHFGFGAGNFYSTPAVAFGRVYMGNTDGFVYSFAARTGQVAWATSTGAYVYASPAVADVPGLGPTVYIGSYSGRLYAFDAQSGRIRWAHPAGGRISGAATIVGNVVYYSDLGTKSTTGLDARTGRVLFRYPDGSFNAIVAGESALYMVGYDTLYELLPSPRSAHRPPPPAHRRPPRRTSRRNRATRRQHGARRRLRAHRRARRGAKPRSRRGR
jgi:outer membrane protein assembly factor BamB